HERDQRRAAHPRRLAAGERPTHLVEPVVAAHIAWPVGGQSRRGDQHSLRALERRSGMLLWLTQSREATWCLGEGRGFGVAQRPCPSPSPSLLRLVHSQERAMPPNKELSPQRAAGCVVYRYDGRAPLVLLILDKYGRWTLPKGHLKAGEREEQAAMREVLEETAAPGTLSA